MLSTAEKATETKATTTTKRKIKITKPVNLTSTKESPSTININDVEIVTQGNFTLAIVEASISTSTYSKTGVFYGMSKYNPLDAASDKMQYSKKRGISTAVRRAIDNAKADFGISHVSDAKGCITKVLQSK